MFLYHSDDQQRCPNLLMMQRLLCPLNLAPNIAKVQKSLCSGWRPSVLPPREKKSPIYRQFRHPAVMTHWLAAITGERSKYGGGVTKTKQACSGSWLLNKNQSSVFQVKDISDKKLVFLPHLFLCRIWVMVHKAGAIWKSLHVPILSSNLPRLHLIYILMASLPPLFRHDLLMVCILIVLYPRQPITGGESLQFIAVAGLHGGRVMAACATPTVLVRALRAHIKCPAHLCCLLHQCGCFPTWHGLISQDSAEQGCGEGQRDRRVRQPEPWTAHIQHWDPSWP